MTSAAMCRLWAAASIIILLGFFANLSTVTPSPNIRRRYTEPRLIADEEKDKKGAGKLKLFFFFFLSFRIYYVCFIVQSHLVSDKFA